MSLRGRRIPALNTQKKATMILWLLTCRSMRKTLSKAERRVEHPLWFSRFAAYLIIGGGKTGKTVFPPGFPSGKYLGIPKEMQISESFVEITQKWENGFPSQGWENRLALPEHLLTPINLNIVIRSFPHHNPIFLEVVNQFGLNAITMLFSAAVCGRNCREKALDETVPFNPSKRARQWMAASLSIHQRELVNGSTDARRWIEASASMD